MPKSVVYLANGAMKCGHGPIELMESEGKAFCWACNELRLKKLSDKKSKSKNKPRGK